MKIKNSILIFLLFWHLGSIAQDYPNFDCKDTTIILLKELNAEVELLLFENSNIEIKTSLHEFKSSIEAWLLMHPQLKSDEKLLNLVIEKSEEKSSLDVIKLAIENRLTERLEYRLADILDSGKCIIINKKNMLKVKEINRETYSYLCGPTCGNGGRIYSFDTIDFFRVMDWIA